jgi:glycosyltransferase involved in cell wall biosynthesis
VSATPDDGRRARVLFLINSLATGGAESQLALTVAHLDRDRFDPVVCCLFSGGPFLEEVERAGVEVSELRLQKSLRAALPGVRRVVAEIRPDLVHTAMFEANVAGRLAARSASVPVISHATNLYESPARYTETAVPRWKLLAARSLERLSARRSRVHVVAVGRAVAASAAGYLRVPPSRVTVVRRGFDFAALEQAAGREPATPAWPEDASPRLLAIGRLAPQKGHRFLLEAMPAIRERHPRAHLCIAGAGPLESDLRSRVEALGPAEAVSLLGVRRDVPALLARADLFVLPSLWEGAAGALVEAMGLGVPVAVTDHEPLREIAGNHAAYFPPADPGAIAVAVSRLADDPVGARRTAAEGIASIREAHDIARNTRALEVVYEAVLSSKERNLR